MYAQPADDLLDGGWFTTEELARMLGVDPSTLRRWRTARPRQGPPFICLSSRVTLYSMHVCGVGWRAVAPIPLGLPDEHRAVAGWRLAVSGY
jgi:helix-turn-helix protein